MKKTLLRINLIFKIDLDAMSRCGRTLKSERKNFFPVWTVMNPFEEIPKCDDDLINIVSCFLIILPNARTQRELKMIGEGLIIHRKVIKLVDPKRD